MLLSSFIRETSDSLQEIYPKQEAGNMVNILCSSILGTKSYTHITDPGYEIPVQKEAVLRAAVERLLQCEPVQYVLGECEFWSRKFKVTPSVLIPRPETELLVQEAVREARGIGNPRIADLCTGSGCIAWSLKLDVPASRVLAVDISDEALKVAESQFDGSDSPQFIKADVLGPVPDGLGKFDVVLSNPPYIMEKEKTEMSRNVLDWEPGLALFVGDDDPLVFYRAVARWSLEILKDGGLGIVEINEKLPSETLAVFSGFQKAEILRDISGKPRFVRYRK